jgi:predicted exporter
VLLTFRSLRPLTLIVLTVVSGCLFALAITLAVFGFVHLFTLVFGASLIGVSVDYSFHYAAEDAFGGQDWTPDKGLRKIFAGITLGLLTSVLAYLALTVAPFPGLQQLALFSSAGLLGAYLTLICCCNLWRRRLTVEERSVFPRIAGWYLDVWLSLSSRYRYLIVGALALAILAGFRLIETNDNVSVLQSQPEELKRQEAMIREILGVDPGSTFLLVPASSNDGVLQLEESLRVTLDGMIDAGTLGNYQAVSRWVPSKARQAQSLAAYSNLISTQLADYFESLGATEDMTAGVVAELTSESEALEVDTWLSDPVSDQFRNLWLDVGEDKSASIILLYGLQNTLGLREALAEFPSIVIANKAEEMSNLFGRYRLRVTWVLAAAYAIILLGLATRYGLRQAAVLLVPPVFAGALALILISGLGNSLNLFNFLALILVLGIGIDFTLFLAEARGDRRITMFAITLSALTTMLSFGLLSLSSTYAVHSFGLTVLIGIACAYLLSPLAVFEHSKLSAE